MKTLTLTPPSSPLAATVEVLGSKSYTNRALIMAALASGVSKLSSASTSADSEAMTAALRLLGVSIEEQPTSLGVLLTVEGTGGALIPYHGEIHVGPAGTTMRFLAALCAGFLESTWYSPAQNECTSARLRNWSPHCAHLELRSIISARRAALPSESARRVT